MSGKSGYKPYSYPFSRKSVTLPCCIHTFGSYIWQMSSGGWQIESHRFGDSFGHTSTHFSVMIHSGHSKDDLPLHAGSPFHWLWGYRLSSVGTVFSWRMGSDSLGDWAKNGYEPLFGRMDTILGQSVRRAHSDGQRVTTTLGARINFSRRTVKC